MEFVTAVLGLLPCLYDHTSRQTNYIRDLEKNLQALGEGMVELNNLYRDVKARVEEAEQRHMMRTNEVGGWMRGVEEMEKEVAAILRSGEKEIRRRCLRCCPRNCWSSYTIGKAVTDKLAAVLDQIEKGHFDVVAQMLPRPRVDELPLPETVGLKLVYDSICGFLKDPQVGITGLYGMGGVGKTTILKKVNNEFLAQSNDFDVVLWVVVSKTPDVERLQKEIWNKLKIPLDVWETNSSQESRAAEILRILKRKRFVALLDDIWERLDLHEMLGIPTPTPQNKSKIVFSTRLLQVCRDMKAQKTVEMACLDFPAAWTLFCKEVGRETLNSHPHIPILAEVVVNECRGLPLALVTLGRTMAAERDIVSWVTVAQDLKTFPAAISGMENQLFHPLKLSYDRLPDDVLKSCFLSCSMFAEDWEINHYFLINLWIGEGIFGMVDDIHETKYRAERVIKTLKHACLLESCASKLRRVKLHDVIRDMALWLYSECGVKKNKVQVYDGFHTPFESLETSKLREAEKISLWDINVEEFYQKLVCPNLNTLMVAECKKLKRFSNGFFRFMPLLRVLDLSGNANLSEVSPEIGELNALTYLNLSFTRIKELPIQLNQLKNLMILQIENIYSVEVNIAPGLISSLISLKFFNMYGTKIPIEFEETLLQELESLDCLGDININISSALSFHKLNASPKLLRCMGFINLYKMRDTVSLDFSSVFKGTRHLTKISICLCYELECVKVSIEQEGIPSELAMPYKIGIEENCFNSLKYIYICDCPKLLDLSWLVYVPFVEDVEIEGCELLNEVLPYDVSVLEIVEKLDIFSRLRYLKLSWLPRLKSIYRLPLPLPSLESIEVYECKSLRSLPFDSNTSTNNLKMIRGEASWWNQLEWNEESVKQSFTWYFDNVETKAYSTYSMEEFAAQSTDGAVEKPNDTEEKLE